MPIEDVEKIVRDQPLETIYDVGNELGRGKFAIVKRCTHKVTGEQFAAKVLKKRRRGKSCRNEILQEIDIMRQANEAMDHPRIIRLKEVFESTAEFHIILELATGGELFRLIAKDPLSEDKSREIVHQILDGVQHLHTLNIVHLDLKPENILLYRKGVLDIKIADFGLSVQVKEGQEMKTLVGTAEYVSPEILNFEPLSTFSDMWSIGALTYALMTGYSPFQGETHQETFLNVSTCDYDFDDEMFDVVTPEAKDFIEKLLIKNPKKRLTAVKCLQHPWMLARKSTNLNSSTSSLDSALCMDSASSMEPSPVSSASSSFSPAPSTTTRSACSTTSTTSNYSQPEDMRKVNEKLTQISTLATERHIAESASKQRAEGSPTSTDSSTSTLKGDESAENIPALVKERESLSSETSAAKPADHDVSSKRAERETSASTSTATTNSLETTDGLKKSERFLSRSTDSQELGNKLRESRPYSSKTGSRTTSMEKRDFDTKLGEKEKRDFSLKLNEKELKAKTTSSRSGSRTSSMETKEFRAKLNEQLRESRELDAAIMSGKRLGTSLESKELELEGRNSSYRAATLDRTTLRSNHRRNLSSEGSSRLTDYKSTMLERPSSRNGSSSYDTLKTSDYTSRSVTLDRSAMRNGSSPSYERYKSSDYATSRSATLDRQNLKSARSYDYSPRSSYKDRSTRTPDTLTVDGSPSAGRKSPSTNNTDVATLDPKTIESLEKYQRIKGAKHRPTTPEPMSTEVTETKQLHSPERRLRRKSEGMTPIKRKTGAHLVKSDPLHEEHIEDRRKEETKKKAEKEEEVTKEETEKIEVVKEKVEAQEVTKDESNLREVVKENTEVVEEVKKVANEAKEVVKEEIDNKKEEKKESEESAEPRLQTRTVTPTNGSEYKPKRGWSKKSYGGDNEISRQFEMGLSYYKKPDNSSAKQKSTKPVQRVSSDSTSPAKQTPSEGASTTRMKRVSSSSRAENDSTSSMSTFTHRTPVDQIWGETRRTSNHEDLSKTFTSTSVRRISIEARSEDISRNSGKNSTDSTLRDSSPLKEEEPRSSSSSPRSKTPTEIQRKISQETAPAVDIGEIPVIRSPSPKTGGRSRTSPTVKSPPISSPSPPLPRSVTPEESSKMSVQDTNPVIVIRSPSESRPSRYNGSSKTDQNEPNSTNTDQQLSTNQVKLRQKATLSEQKRQIITNRRKTPVISEDALDKIMKGLIPDEELEVLESDACPVSASSRDSVALETCPEEDESAKYSPPSTRANKILKTAKSPPRSPEKKVTIRAEVSCAEKRRGKYSERTKSLSSISPNRSPSPISPPPSVDPFSKSMDGRDFKGPVSRLRVSSMTLSRSTPDLSEILNSGKKKSKAKRVERSNSRRNMASGHHRLDSYVTSMSPHMVYDSTIRSSGSVSYPNKSSSRTLPSRVLGGQAISKVFSSFSRKDKERKDHDGEGNTRRKRLW